MLTFNFYMGGYFGRSHFIYLDGKSDDKKLKYGRTEGGIRIDLSRDYMNYDDDPKVYYKEVEIDEEVFNDFVEEIYLINIDSWDTDARDRSGCDGTRWYVSIKPKDGGFIEKTGNNKYPINWRKLMTLLNEYTCERIG